MKKVCVMGLGYIGLPTASVLASNGFQVLGVDTKASVVDTVNEGNIHIEEPGLHTMVKAATGSGNLRASLSPEASDVFFLSVPTPMDEDKKADMAYVQQATEMIVPFLKQGDLVILESTSPPGTCRDLICPILEAAGFAVGTDIYLAHCPERVLPGRILKELIENDRVIGGFGPDCAKEAEAIYSKFVEGGIFLTDVTTAEMVKVIENTFRDVNIALANEAAVLCEKLGIQFSDVARLANRHPRVNLHTAGPGVGGHCISVDPWFLIEKFPEDTAVMHAARKRNDSMPAHVVESVNALVGKLTEPKIATLGLAYKGNVDDMRESPSVTVVGLLRAAGKNVAAHDPYAKDSTVGTVDLDGTLQGADCLVLLTDHDEYKALDPTVVAEQVRTKILFDTRNQLDHDAWRNAGFEVKVLGAGTV